MFAWKNVYGVPFTLAHTAPLLLLVCLFLEKEVWVWAGGFAVLLLTMKFPSAMTPTALVVAMVYGLQGRKKRQPRFYLGTVVYFYFALWAIGWKGGSLPEPKLWLMLATTLVLIVMAWTWRLPSAIPATILVMLPGGGLVVPKGSIQWGAFALVIGFVSLIAGVAASWTLGGSGPDEEEIILME